MIKNAPDLVSTLKKVSIGKVSYSMEIIWDWLIDFMVIS